MGYVLMWVESLTVALLLQVLVTAFAAGWPRFLRILVPIFMAIALLALATGTTFVVGILRFSALILSMPFPSVLVWTIGFAVGAAWIIYVGLRRSKDDGAILAACSWPRGRLALATVAALIVNGITFTNMDMAMKIHLAGVRAEAGAQILALAPPRVPDRDNAAPVYLEAFEALTPSAKLPEAWREKESDWLNLEMSQWKPSDKDVAAFLASQEFGLSLFRQAAAMPACSFDGFVAAKDMAVPNWKLNQKLRRGAHLLALDAVVKASRGDAKGATLDIAAVRGITTHLADQLALPSLLTAAANEQLEAEALQEVLSLVRLEGGNLDQLALGQGVSYREKLRRAMRSEIAFGLACFAFAGGEDSDDLSAEMKEWLDGYIRLVPKAVWRVFFMQDDLSAYRHRMREAEALIAKPHYEARDGWMAFNRSFHADFGGMLTKLIFGAYEKIVQAMTNADAKRELARLALAATAFRNKTGQYPERLEDLVPAHLPQVPIDPFDGKPLRMKRVAEGIVLYSVGPDMKDNGGQAYDATERTGDVVFTLRKL